MNSVYNFILYNSCSLHNCIKTYNKNLFTAGTVPLTIDGTVLKESNNLDILGVTFDSKLVFEKHLCSVSRAASQRLGILKSWWVFHGKFLIGRYFWGFVLPILEYCSAVWHLSADTHLKLLDRIVSGACILAGGMLNCDLSHCRSVAV